MASSLVRLVIHLVVILCQFHIVYTSAIICARMRPGLCQYAPGDFHIFHLTFCANLCDFEATMVSSLVRLVIHLEVILCQISYCVHKYYCLPKACARMRPGLCQYAPGDLLHILCRLLCKIVRLWEWCEVWSVW